MQSISLAFARALIDAIGTTETSLGALAINCVEAAPATRSDSYLPMHELSRLLDEAQLRTGNEDLGLLAYQKAHPGHLGLLGYAIMSSPTLADAMACMVDHHSVIGNGFCMFMDTGETTLRMVGLSASSQDMDLPRAFIDAVAAITLGLLHWLAPSASITPVTVEFTYEKPRDTERLEQLFGRDLRFSCAVNAMTFQRSDADLAIATFDPSLKKIHDHYLRQCQDEMHVDSIATKIKSAIMQHLHQAKPVAMKDIASSLRLSAHQLTKALGKEELSFQKMVDMIRRQHSHHLLTNTALSFKQISYSVGFKNSSAFNKACERWFGMPPGSYRSNAVI